MKKNVLLIDDDLDHLAVLAVGLVGIGYNVIPEIEAGPALAALRRNERIDVIIVDLEMQGFDPWSFIAMHRHFMPNVPIIVLSRHANVAGYIKVMEHGAFEYMNKPVRVGELRRVIDAALSGSHQSRLPQVVN